MRSPRWPRWPRGQLTTRADACREAGSAELLRPWDKGVLILPPRVQREKEAAAQVIIDTVSLACWRKGLVVSLNERCVGE